MIDYALIAGVFLYLVMVQVSAAVYVYPLWSATVVVGGGTAISLLTRWIAFGGRDVPLIDMTLILTLIAQWIMAVIVFYKLQASEDTYSAWFVWGAAGVILIFFVVPQLVSILL